MAFIVPRVALSSICHLVRGKISGASFQKFLPMKKKKETDPWYQFSSAIDEINSIHQSELVDSLWISINETMSALNPRKMTFGGLPNISFIVRKPEPLGKTLTMKFYFFHHHN